MNLQTLPHFARPVNVDLITRVRAVPGYWHFKEDRRAVRRLWGKPVRKRGWSYLERTKVRIYLVGDIDNHIEVECKPGEAERWVEDIQQTLRALREHGPERIVAAAIQTTEINRGTLEIVGMVHSLPAPARHHHILHALPTPDPADVIGPHQQGFLTSTGRFVKRKEAMGIAVAAGQVPASKVSAPDLFSEDLW